MSCFHPKKAIALVLAYSMIASMIVIGGAQLHTAVVDARGATRSFESQKSLWVAEAGIAHARKALSTDTWTDWTTSGSTKTRTFTYGGQSTTVTVTASGSTTTISSLGTSTFGSQTGSYPKTVQLTATRPSKFKYAAFALHNFTVNSNAGSDSYDSRLGLYSATNKGNNGDIGTNGTLITLNSNSFVKGDIAVGPGGVVQVNSNVTVTGNVTTGINEAFGVETVPTAVSSLSSSGWYNLNSNETRSLAAGTYKFDGINANSNSTLNIGSSASDTTILYVTGGMNLNSNSTINVTGKLIIYINGDLNMNSNGIVHTDYNPLNLLIYGTASTSQNININSNNNVYGAIYAPNATVSLNSNTDTYGAVVANYLNYNSNGDIHYDEALASIAGSGGYTFSNWRQS
jgi:hypothetical protein